ncbi:hypothetical protein JKA74_07295 [Marivirga sp. S37H4]|uniref:Uncharacterized protein n=1 Tax=Marivirga aurantiaca TaxID=2802615 RepID=A0A935C774_9BACT|nr:hypothetical protein [Marivirga aurantiaca]MBK6264836.1 hypothetical protein [Marivirga aurantiaca]
MEEKRDLKYWESFFQSLQMNYYGLLAAPLFLFAIVFLRSENGNNTLTQLSLQMEIYFVGFVSFFALIVVLYLHFFAKNRNMAASKEKDLENKMKIYKRTTLIKYVSLSIYQVIIVFTFACTYHNAMMGLFTALLLYASFFRPELQTVRRDLRLSKEEYKQINYKA